MKRRGGSGPAASVLFQGHSQPQILAPCKRDLEPRQSPPSPRQRGPPCWVCRSEAARPSVRDAVEWTLNLEVPSRKFWIYTSRAPEALRVCHTQDPEIPKRNSPGSPHPPTGSGCASLPQWPRPWLRTWPGPHSAFWIKDEAGPPVTLCSQRTPGRIGHQRVHRVLLSAPPPHLPGMGGSSGPSLAALSQQDWTLCPWSPLSAPCPASPPSLPMWLPRAQPSFPGGREGTFIT